VVLQRVEYGCVQSGQGKKDSDKKLEPVFQNISCQNGIVTDVTKKTLVRPIIYSACGGAFCSVPVEKFQAF
jgi:hypothetical protein